MKTLLILVTLLASSISFAGPGGGHSHGHGHSHDVAPTISKEKTGEIGRYQIERLIKAKKLDTSWKNATFEKLFQRKVNGL